MTQRSVPGATVGYLTKRFPRLSETFILDEIIGLERAGVPLRLFAIADPMEEVVQPDVSQVASTVTYLRGKGWSDAPKGILRTLAAHARLVVSNPARYRRTLALALVDRASTNTIRPFLDAGRLALELRRANAVHLHAAFAHGPATTARYVHHLTGLPFSFAAHAKDLYLSDADELAVKAADAEFVLSCSAAAAAGILERAVPVGAPDAEAPRWSSKVVLAYHGVDTSRFRPLERPPTGEGGLRVLAVGRLVAKKGYPILLAALALVRESGQEVSCRIVGGGSDKARLVLLAEELGLAEAVTFLGPRTHQQVAEEYGRADVFVQASVVLADGDRDGIPNSLLEAMASGVPVVASTVSGIPEAVDDEVSGLLVQPGDPAALARALSRLAENRQLAGALAGAARSSVVERFDRQLLAERLARRFWSDEPAAARTEVVA